MVSTHELFDKEAVLWFVYYYMFSNNAFDRAIATITDLLQRGGLRHPIANRYSLHDVAIAHESVEQGHVVGKNVIDIADPTATAAMDLRPPRHISTSH